MTTPTPDAIDRQDNYYEILNLSRSRTGEGITISKEELKTAYHHALLLHHPDKASMTAATGKRKKGNLGPDSEPTYSIDQIVQAFQTLSDSNAKALYDKQLARPWTVAPAARVGSVAHGTHLGIEVFDLEDLQYDEQRGVWFKPCRCGHDDGYTMTEIELEREIEQGEIYVGCRGCSLFIKVLFGVAEG